MQVKVFGSANIQFRDEYLKQGHQGGQLAAQTLLSALPRLIAEAEASPKLKGAEVTVKANVNDSADQADIVQKELGSVVVHVFLNKSGLGTVLTKVSCPAPPYTRCHQLIGSPAAFLVGACMSRSGRGSRLLTTSSPVGSGACESFGKTHDCSDRCRPR